MSVFKIDTQFPEKCSSLEIENIPFLCLSFDFELELILEKMPKDFLCWRCMLKKTYFEERQTSGLFH